jgi:hypothetical protein
MWLIPNDFDGVSSDHPALEHLFQAREERGDPLFTINPFQYQWQISREIEDRHSVDFAVRSVPSDTTRHGRPGCA